MNEIGVRELVELLQAMINDLSKAKYDKHKKRISEVMNSEVVQEAFKEKDA